MVRSIGLDIVEVDRVAGDIDRFGRRFVNRLLGPVELDVFDRRRDKAAFLAGRLAAKEAVIKALGYYLETRPRYRDMQIISAEGGAPTLVLPREVQIRLGRAQCLLSLSHERHYAAAVAVLQEEP